MRAITVEPGVAVRDLGGTCHRGAAELARALPVAIVLECAGAGEIVLAALQRDAPHAIVCLTGVSSGGRRLAFNAGAFNRDAVLGNAVVFGTVNANVTHHQAAVAALAAADRAWLGRLITRRVPPDRWPEAFERRAGDVKVMVDFGLDSL